MKRKGGIPKKQNQSDHQQNTHQHQQNKQIKEKKQKMKGKQNEFFIDKILIFVSSFHKRFQYPQNIKISLSIVDIFLCLLATSLSLYTHFCDFGQPNTVVFDEVYFGNFTNYYSKGSYFFDIHPPLGKELLYFGSILSNYDGNLMFTHIGQEFPNNHIKKLRFWPSLTGSLITPIIYFTLRLNECSYLWSCVCSILPALDNAMLVESRFVLIDSYLWFFAVLCVFFCALATRCPKHTVLFAVLTGLAAGATTSVKFTGAGVAIGVVIAFFMHFPFFTAFKMSFLAGISGIFVLISSFVLHFKLLKHPGMGCKFHPRKFCVELAKGNINSFVETFKLIKTMLSSNFAIQESHPYSSKWWQWPLQLGYGNWMWVEGDRQLWCVGSPVVWYFAFFGTIGFVITCFFSTKLRRSLWIFLCYLLSYLPFGLIHRAMWNYHYIIPLELSIICSALFCSASNNKYINLALPLILLVLALFGYVILIPITYGHPITQKQFESITFKRWHY